MKNKSRNNIIAGIFILAIIGIILYNTNLLPFASVPSDVKLAIPHFASYKCDVLQDVFGQTINVPESGALISRSTVGYYTNGVSNINAEITESVWEFWIGFPLRVRYSKCDANGNNCGNDQTVTYYTWGKKQLGISSLDFNRESLKIYFERGYGVLGIYYWDEIDKGKVSFDSKKFGLTLSSTTQDPAGKIICSTSCDLSCPDIGYRQDLVYNCNGNSECMQKGTTFTTSDILGFYDTAPYLEYWETIDYDFNQQGGATIYNSATNKFCFAGTIYKGKTITLGSGTYTYPDPDTNTRQYLQCCPGAVISSTYSDKACQNDGTWKVIQDTDKLTCISDINCPGAGNLICQNKQLFNGYSCINRDANGVGICQKASGTNVECCDSNDCNRDQVCDISTHTCKGGSSLPTCGNGILEAGEQCDDGNNIGGDGCSSICESEVKCNVDSDCEEGQVCKDGVCVGQIVCEDCFGWLFSKLNTDEKQCEPKIYYESKWYNPMTWVIPEGGITQDEVCPIFLIVMCVIGALVILIFFLILSIISNLNYNKRKK